MYNSSLYTNLKNLFSFFLDTNNPKNNFFPRRDLNINFFSFLFLKKFFSNFYFLFFYPKGTDYEFLKKISFYSDNKINSIFYDYKYFSDYEFFLKIKNDVVGGNYFSVGLDDNIFPFGRKENFIRINFSQIISEIIPILNFYNLDNSQSAEISFILFFSNIINFGEKFSDKINPIIFIYLDEKIKYSEFPIFEKIKYDEFKKFVEKLFSDTVPPEISNSVNFNFTEADYFYILEFMRKLLLFNFLKNILSVKYEKINFEDKKYLPDNFSDIKNKILEYLKTDFWNFHKLSFFYYFGINEKILKIKNSLISDINSKYAEIRRLEISIQMENKKLEKNDFSNFLKNSFIYYLFYKFFGDFIKNSIYDAPDNFKNYSMENINNQIIILYRFWEEFINNLDEKFSNSRQNDNGYMKDEINKLYNVYGEFYDTLYDEIFGGGDLIRTYPLVNYSTLVYNTEMNFLSSYYPYLIRQCLFL